MDDYRPDSEDGNPKDHRNQQGVKQEEAVALVKQQHPKKVANKGNEDPVNGKARLFTTLVIVQPSLLRALREPCMEPDQAAQ